jgi:two-component system OmpR family sensor kinase
MKPPPKGKGKGPPRSEEVLAPPQVVFDIRAAVSREALNEQLGQLAWYLAGGFPVALGLAAVGGLGLIRRAVRPVEQAFHRERRFTGAVSHELRTPLTALRGEIELALRRERTAEEYADVLRRLQPVVARMADMVEGLLVLARAKAGHLLLGAGEVGAGAIHRAAEEVIEMLPGRERVTVCCTVAEDRKVVGDGLLLALAVRNLVENALIHGGGVRVHLQADSTAGLRLTVEDEGPGLPPEVLATFAEGRSTPGASLARDGGGGFGLSIARAVVEAHGGVLALASRPEGGCRAELWLPGLGGA